MHNTLMRTTVNLDNEIYELAVLRARGQDITLGAAIGEFIREAMQARQQRKLSPNLKRLPNGLLVLKKRKDGPVLTAKLVKKLIQEMDDEEDERKAFPAGRPH